MRFSFGDLVVDESRFVLTRGGEPVRIEPRVLDVLLYLLRNRGRVVSKEELIECVWKGSFVTESALTRCISEARRAIDDQKRQPPFLKTVHGRGYRFDGEALELDEAPLTLTPSIPAMIASPVVQRRSAPHRALLALTLLMLLALSGGPSSSAPVDLRPPSKIALLPISTEDDSTENALLALSIGDLLQQRLAQVPGLLVRPADYGVRHGMEAKSLAEFAATADVSYVVSGTLRRADGSEKAQLVVTLHEIRPHDDVRDTPLGRYDVPLLGKAARVAEFTTVRENIARRLLATLLPAVHPTWPGIAAAPRDPSAYRLYLLAIARLGAGTCDGESAIELLRRSIEIDRGFAPAWEAYGWAHYRLVSTCGADASHYREALQAADHALLLAPDAIGALALKTAVLVESGKAEEAYAALRARERQFGSSPDLNAGLSHVMTYAGQLELAQGWSERLERLDPNFLTHRGWTPNPYLYAGRSERFLAALPATETPLFRYHRGLALIILGRREEARRVLEPAFRLNPSDVYARLSQALLSILDARPEESQAILRQMARERMLVGRHDGETSYKIGQVLALAGDEQGGLSQIELAVSQGFFCAPCLEGDPLIESVRAMPRFGQIAARARLRQSAFSRRFGLSETTVRRVATKSPAATSAGQPAAF